MAMYTFKEPSLKRIAEVKIVCELWRQEVIRIEIAPDIKIQSYYPFDDRPFKDIWPLTNALKNQVIENNIIKKVSALPLPTIVKENLLNLVKPLGSEIKSWWCYHNNLGLRIPRKLCWTSRGAVHYKNTAELIVQDENVDVKTRYTMACMYCLEKEIHVLWNRIPETNNKRFYYFEDRFPRWPFASRDLKHYGIHMVMFWTYTINNKITELHKLIVKTVGVDYTCLYKFALEWAIHGLNLSATEFFFEKLSSKEKEDASLSFYTRNVLRSSLFHSCKIETAIFLLNRMSVEQQEELFRVYFMCAFDLLETMLHWPHQTLFLETAKKWFHYLSTTLLYSKLFNLICDIIKSGKNDYDYEELFVEFWQIASVNNIDFFLDNSILFRIVLLHDVKKDLVKYVLNQATDVQKEQLLYIKLFSTRNLSLVIDWKKGRFLNFLLSECITCKETIINFKENVELQHSRERDAKSKVKLIRALGFVNEAILKWKRGDEVTIVS